MQKEQKFTPVATGEPIGSEANTAANLSPSATGDLLGTTQSYKVCAYCGAKEINRNSFVGESTIKRAQKKNFDFKQPCCAHCWSKLFHRMPKGLTANERLERSMVLKLKGMAASISPRSGYEQFIELMNSVNATRDCEYTLECSLAEAIGLIKSINGRLEWLRNNRSEAIAAIEAKLHVNYEYCRHVANEAIRDVILRKQVFSRDDCRCRWCGTTENLSIDHIVPVKSGGGNGLENLQTLCLRCNGFKGDSPNEEAFRELALTHKPEA